MDNVDSYGAYNDSNPNYWTSVDEEYILFDSYNQNLVSNKARFFGTRTPSTMTLDTDEPDLPQQFRSVLLYGSLAEAFYTLKSDDSLGDRYARHFKEGLTAMKKWARTVNKEKDTAYNVDYGRKVFSSQVTNRNIIDD